MESPSEPASAYEQALLAKTNPAHVRLFLFICDRLQDKEVDEHAAFDKSSMFAGAFMSMINDKSVGFSKIEVGLLFDIFVQWYATPKQDHYGRTTPRTSIRWKVDYGPDADFGDLLSSWTRAVKARRGPNGPAIPRSRGVGMKCYYSVADGHANFSSTTLDHHGQPLKIEPWKKFFDSEDPTDREIALELQPKIPWEISRKLFYRNILRKCGLTTRDAPAFFLNDCYYFGEYLYELEAAPSPEANYAVVRAISLCKETYLAKTILEGKPCLLVRESQTRFSHRTNDMDAYCPLFRILVNDPWSCHIKGIVPIPIEHIPAFAEGFIAAVVASCRKESHRWENLARAMGRIFSTEHLREIVQVLIPKLEALPNHRDLEDFLTTCRDVPSPSLPLQLNLPSRMDIEDTEESLDVVDPRFFLEWPALCQRICTTMNFTLADGLTLIKNGCWGILDFLLETSRTTDLKLIDAIWNKCINAEQSKTALRIYELGYPIFHYDDHGFIEFEGSMHGGPKYPFLELLKNFPVEVAESPRTTLALAPSKDFPGANIDLYHEEICIALSNHLYGQKLEKNIQVVKLLLSKLLPDEEVIEKRSFEFIKSAISRSNYGNLPALQALW